MQIQQAAGVINGNTPQTITFQYDNGNRRTQTVLSNGVTATYAYDNANQLLSVVYTQSSGTTIGNLTYTYDAGGHRTSVGGSLANVSIPATALGGSYDANNRLSQLNGSTLTYDGNGNSTTDGTNSYSWDARNQLASVSGPVNASFQYDAVGRRVQKTIGSITTGYLYDGSNFVQEQNAAGAPTATLLTGGVDQIFARMTSVGISVPMTDALGSVIGETNPAQSVTTSVAYEPYGTTTQSGTNTGNSQQYAGRENDGTGLYYNRARYYNPALGRFISEDPIGFSGGTNVYAYVGGNPGSFIDPLGLAQFGYRPLGRLPWLDDSSRNPLDDYFHTDIAHEQLFFEDGLNPSDLGFFKDDWGGGLQSGEDPSQYHMDPVHYDDQVMRQAVKNVDPGRYSLIGNNCQTYADNLRAEYRRLIKTPLWSSHK
jgi:RHS repeat-associated protein